MILCYRGYIPGTVMNEFGYQEAEWINLGVLLIVRVPIYMILNFLILIVSNPTRGTRKINKSLYIYYDVDN